jgi:large subunit ribosomal protein L10
MKEEKQILVDALKESVHSSPFLYVVDFTGLTVKRFTELRNRLAAANSELHVFKNTLIRRVGQALDFPEALATILAGQSAVVYGQEEAPAVAKILKNFQAEFEKPAIKGGVLDGRFLTADNVKALANLPGKDQLRAQLLGLFNAPASQLVRTLNEPASALARVLKAWHDKQNP